MRPSRTFLFLLTVIVCLSLLSVFFYPQKWRTAFGLHAQSGDLSLVTDDAVLSSAVTVTDSTFQAVNDSSLFIVDSIKDVHTEPFCLGCAIADTIKKGGQFRIMFYGDSQLEGDRMTSLMRSTLREQSGGTGTGLFSPVMPVMYTRSFVVKSSANWKRYTWLDYKHGKLTSSKFGPVLSLCRFTSPGDISATPVTAWVRVTSVPGSDHSAAVYENLRIFYGNVTDTVEVKVFNDGVQVSSGRLYPSNGVAEYSCPLDGRPDVRVEFSGRISPDIYTMSIESRSGIVVDNIPLRGSAGLEFVMTDRETFSESLELLKPDLIILQYGLNVVRNVRNDYSYYEEGLVRQIEYLKNVSGGVPVLLISLTDMAETRGDSIRYFTNIPAIRDVQRKAALRTGSLFWDAWDAMGGKGSVIKWAGRSPALATSDLTHLSNAGADTIVTKLLADVFRPENKTASSVDTVAVTPKTAAIPLLFKDSLAGKADTVNLAVKSPQKTLFASLWNKVVSFVRYDPAEPFVFTSTAFWIFLLIVLLGFSSVVKHKSMRNTWLLLVSLWFYYKAGGLFFLLLLFTSLVNYIAGLVISSSVRKGVRKLWLIISIFSGIGLLAYFKYAAFLTETVNTLFHTSFVCYDFLSDWSNAILGTGFDTSLIVLPVGISFFTFQALSYTIDIYRKKVTPVRSFIDFSFYVAFFPHLVAGPIVRASEFVPQMYKEYSLTRNEWGHAVFLILQGLIKKMIISDFIAAGFIDRIFNTPTLYSGFENLLAVYGYGIQIYCDFSGYTDIAIGIALLMGFRLPVNFNSPYKASNISDFWKRWHISLSRWLKDYLYIPLGGNRGGSIRTGLNLIITMLIGGLWHGASLRFVLWGGLHGAGIIINKIWKSIFKKSRQGSRLSTGCRDFYNIQFCDLCLDFLQNGIN